MTARLGGRPIVWVGRGGADGAEGWDGWNTSLQQLVDALPNASELVVHDPLSFPWGHRLAASRGVPFTATLPGELDADGIIAALGEPVLRQVTRFDRIVEPRPEVREALTSRYRLDPAIWEAATPTDLAERRTGKARLYEVVAAVVAALGPVLSAEAETLIGFVGRAGELGGPVATRHALYDVTASPDEPPAPDALVVWLDDGLQSTGERATLLSRARELLHPGGRLVVVGYVVNRPDGPVNPAISTLAEELNASFGGMLQVDDLRSVRWRGELLSRGVVIAGTALGAGRP